MAWNGHHCRRLRGRRHLRGAGLPVNGQKWSHPSRGRAGAPREEEEVIRAARVAWQEGRAPGHSLSIATGERRRPFMVRQQGERALLRLLLLLASPTPPAGRQELTKRSGPEWWPAHVEGGRDSRRRPFQAMLCPVDHTRPLLCLQGDFGQL